jgi:ABC-type enterochelin transport system substrate-binding protein
MGKREMIMCALSATRDADDSVFNAIVSSIGAKRLAEIVYIPPDKNLLANPGNRSLDQVVKLMSNRISQLEAEIRNMCPPQS